MVLNAHAKGMRHSQRRQHPITKVNICDVFFCFYFILFSVFFLYLVAMLTLTFIFWLLALSIFQLADLNSKPLKLHSR